MEKLNINKEEPKEVLYFFKDISNIPRNSGDEKNIRDYLVNFAIKRNLEYYTDEYYNVIIKKPASKGYENQEILALQAHTDMICEKENWSKHDFSKDPIELLKDGDFIKANGTTLGADNGIGVALMLAILDSENIKTPELECIFTVQEETTMIGVQRIDVNQIKAKKIISLDNGKEDKMVISSANCLEWYGKIKKEYVQLENMNSFELTYSNFPGGHSGGNIADIKRGNPIKLGIDLLSKLNNVYINEISGGSKVNVIPRDFKVKFSCTENAEAILNNEINKQKDFFGNNIELTKINNLEKGFSLEISRKIINFINSYNNGALKFDENQNVILSANFGAINEFEDYIRLEYSLRSNNIQYRNEYLNNLNIQITENDIDIIWSQELSGFEPDYSSQLVKKVSDTYNKLYGKEIEKVLTQGVLEGGFFKSRIENLEYVCIGANTFDAHSPKERVSISSIQRVWNLLIEILKNN